MEEKKDALLGVSLCVRVVRAYHLCADRGDTISIVISARFIKAPGYDACRIVQGSGLILAVHLGISKACPNSARMRVGVFRRHWKNGRDRTHYLARASATL